MNAKTKTMTFSALTVILLSGMVTRAVPAAPPAAADTARIERGAYLATTMGCHDCHTPITMGPRGPEPDMTRALTGHPQGMMVRREAHTPRSGKRRVRTGAEPEPRSGRQRRRRRHQIRPPRSSRRAVVTPSRRATSAARVTCRRRRTDIFPHGQPRQPELLRDTPL